MTMEPVEIEKMIREAFPTADITVDGDGRHFTATVEADEFKGLSRVAQHRLVNSALKGKMDGPAADLHALALTTRARGS